MPLPAGGAGDRGDGDRLAVAGAGAGRAPGVGRHVAIVDAGEQAGEALRRVVLGPALQPAEEGDDGVERRIVGRHQVAEPPLPDGEGQLGRRGRRRPGDEVVPQRRQVIPAQHGDGRHQQPAERPAVAGRPPQHVDDGRHGRVAGAGPQRRPGRHRDAVAAQGPGHRPAVAGGVADQHGHARPRHALRPGGQQLAGHGLGLGGRMPAGDQDAGGRPTERLVEGDVGPGFVRHHHGVGRHRGQQVVHGRVVVVDQHVVVPPRSGDGSGVADQPGRVDLMALRQHRLVPLGEPVELPAPAGRRPQQGAGHLLREHRPAEVVPVLRPVRRRLEGEQPPDHRPLLRRRQQPHRPSFPGHQVERHAEPRGDREGVEPARERRQHRVPEPGGRRPVMAHDQHRGRPRTALHQPQVPPDHRCCLPAARPAGHAQRASAVLHDPALGRRQLHTTERNDRVRQDGRGIMFGHGNGRH